MLVPLQAAGLIEKNNTIGQYHWHSVISANGTGKRNGKRWDFNIKFPVS